METFYTCFIGSFPKKKSWHNGLYDTYTFIYIPNIKEPKIHSHLFYLSPPNYQIVETFFHPDFLLAKLYIHPTCSYVTRIHMMRAHMS